MKKILCLLLLIPGMLFSQTLAEKKKIIGRTNTTALRQAAATYKIQFQRNKELALQLAKFHHWDREIVKGNHYSELIGVDKNYQPIYYTTYNEGAGITTRANKLYSGGGLGLNLHGENMTSAMWDAGFALASHELFSGRLQTMDDCNETRAHSTHVAGTIMGSNLFQSGHARGMAFKSNLQSYDWDNDVSEVATAAANGLLLSNHSYGYSPFAVQDYQWGKYDGQSQAFDEIMFNAPYYQFVCAAGNSRGNFNPTKNGYDLLTGQGLCKNGITVGAVEEVLNYTGPGSVVMSETSSWGPTDDGRIKPDIVAKGVNTFSSTNASNQSYGYSSGTSMASPSVEGTLLLLQQYYNQRNGSFMRASTLKGLMIHTADEAGTNPGPDYSFGWGLINAEKAANVITKNGLQSYILENTLNQGNTYAVTVDAVGDEPLIATLCWTDPKGNFHSFNVDDTTADLVNDLDIRISQSGDTFFPWKLNGANPSNSATQGDNIVDNVEKTEIANPSGTYVVTVSHKGNLTNNSQPYSLIISGIILKDFWFTAAENFKNVCQNTASVNFPLTLNLKSGFNQTITFSTANLPVGSVANFSQLSMNAAGNFSLTLNNLNGLAPGNYPFTVKGQSASDVFEMTLTLNVLASGFSNVVLQQPSDNQNVVSNPVNFHWQSDQNAEQYEVQIATDNAFTIIAESAIVNLNSYTSTSLSNDNTYFWRVRKKNQCGNGSYSDAFTFKTACDLPHDLALQDVGKTSATIGWSDIGTSWTYKVVLHNGSPSGSGTLTNSNPLTLNDLQPNTCYDFYFKNTCSTGGPIWSDPFEFCTTPDYCGGDHFYDSGGAGGNYHSNEDKTTTIYPENAGERVRAVFNSFQLDNCCDYLIVFNGPDDTAPFLLLANGDNSPGSVASTDPSGALTFVFHSNGNDNASGWNASIICEPMPACPNAPDHFELTQSTYTSATIQWQDNSGSGSWDIEVVPHNGTPTGVATDTVSTNPLTLNGLNQNSCYDFYIRSICAGGTSGWAGPYTFCTAANYCGGDHFYDSGGATANYQNYEYKTTVIAPDAVGNRVRVVFNVFDIENCCDDFKIFNGADTDAPLLYDSHNNSNAPGTVASTDASGKLTFLFASDGFHTDDGWDASVICEPLPACAAYPYGVHAENIAMHEADIEWYNNSSPESWNIEIVPQGNVPTGNGLNVNNNHHTFSGLDSNSCYDVYLQSVCTNGNSAWSPAFAFCTLANYCAGDHFYDSGGATGNYSNDEYNTTVIYPDQPGDRVRVTFNSFNAESCCDRLKIYNGPSKNYPMLHSSSSGTPTTYASTHSSGALTFVFISNDENTAAGWDATITCEALPVCANVPTNVHVIAMSSKTAKVGWTENSSANSWEVKVAPHNITPPTSGTTISDSDYTFSGLDANTQYDCYVRSICGQTTSAWTAAYSFFTEPDYCSSGHFYDSGGASNNYQNGEDKITIIYPGNADQKVHAQFNTYDLESCCDYLRIYNGPDTSYPLLYNDAAVSPGTVASTDASGALTFEFHSDGSSNAQGWDATIECVFLATESQEPFTQLAYYPNPVTQTLFINAYEKVKKYSIYNIDGRLVREYKIELGRFEIDMRDLSSGSYFVKLTNESGAKTRTIKVLKR